MSLTKLDLDAFVAGGCDIPGCDHSHADKPLFLHCRNHLGGRIEVSYLGGSGEMRIGCKECGGTIAVVKVGD